MLRRKKVQLVAVSVVFLLIAGLAALIVVSQPKPPQALTDLLYLMYDAPNPQIWPLELSTFVQVTPNLAGAAPEEYDALLRDLFGAYVAEDYLEDFAIKYGWAYQRFADQAKFSFSVKDLSIQKGENRYDYTLTLTCIDQNGTSTDVDLSGSARVNADGMVENVNPHGDRALLQVIGLR